MSSAPADVTSAGDVRALERLEQFGGPALAERMIHLFLTEMPRRIAAASAALDAGDVAGVKRVAHMMRSSCGQLGAPGMEALTLAIESTDDHLAIRDCLTRLDAELARYAAWVDRAALAKRRPS